MINLKNTQTLASKDDSDETVRDAISNIYYYSDTHEWLLDLDWNGFQIPLDGTHIGGMYDDIITMLNNISDNKNIFTISFLESAFTAIWYFKIENSSIEIKAAWTSIIGAEEGEEEPIDQLNKLSDTITISKKDFMNEWAKLLTRLKEDLIKVGYDRSLEGWDDLEKYSQMR